MPKLKSSADLAKLKKQILAKRAGKRYVAINAAGTCGLAYGSDKLYKAFVAEIKKQGLSKEVEVRATGCMGFCENSPKVMILPDDINYFKVKPEDVSEIVSKTLGERKIVDRLLYHVGSKNIVKLDDIPFYSGQSRIISGNNRYIDPENIDDYIALGGYSALAQVLGKMEPKDVLDTVKKSSLRGRGGGGFPTGVKWETSVNAPSDIKYVIVNADEGDPGAYMNRALLEGNPHSVMEGLIIGAYAVGAKEGYIYVRQEYPLAIKHLYVALDQAREYGLLGENILGSGFDFDIIVHQGAGAFVSGESSALMTAIEGRVGEPRPKYIRTAVSGIREKPSVLNNVETWANVPLIINKGVDWFTGVGTKDN